MAEVPSSANLSMMYNVNEELKLTCLLGNSKEWNLYLKKASTNHLGDFLCSIKCRENQETSSLLLPVITHVIHSESECKEKLCATLYNHLFGQEEYLIDSTILLLGCPDGLIHAIPLKSVTFRSRVICDLHQPVRYLCASSIFERTKKDAVIFIGMHGKVAVFLSSKEKNVCAVVYRELQIASPIISVCVNGSKIVLSTGNDILYYELKSMDSKNSDIHFVKTTLGICGVTEVSWLSGVVV